MSECFFTTNLLASTEKNFFYLALSPFNQEKHTPSAHSRPASASQVRYYREQSKIHLGTKNSPTFLLNLTDHPFQASCGEVSPKHQSRRGGSGVDAGWGRLRRPGGGTAQCPSCRLSSCQPSCASCHPVILSSCQLPPPVILSPPCVILSKAKDLARWAVRSFALLRMTQGGNWDRCQLSGHHKLLIS